MREFCSMELLSQPGDATALARNIESLATDAELRRPVSAAALNKVNSAFTLNHSRESLEVLYAQAIAKIAGSR